MVQKQGIALLGSTGSIGTQALEVIRENPDRFEVIVLVARRSTKLLIAQAKEFKPRLVVIEEASLYTEVKEALQPLGIETATGAQAIEDAVCHPAISIVLTAMVGFAGLRPTLAAIQAKKTIALANKETLVVAGALIQREATRHGVRILPVDSEHSAIFQCLIGETTPVEKLLLTASGGPFRQHSLAELEQVTATEALRHPNWVMGAKVTIDSASLMNKGLEMIEAHWLFAVPAQQIEVLIHPQSIVHSMVQFADGSVKAQLGAPDMRLPIGYALGLTERVSNSYPRLDFSQYNFTFERPDLERFPNLSLAYRALELGGTAPCVLNAANEVAVEAFLSGHIGFRTMSDLVAEALTLHRPEAHYDLPLLEALDAEVRQQCSERLPHL